MENVNLKVIKMLSKQIANILNINKPGTVAEKTLTAFIDLNSSKFIHIDYFQ